KLLRITPSGSSGGAQARLVHNVEDLPGSLLEDHGDLAANETVARGVGLLGAVFVRVAVVLSTDLNDSPRGLCRDDAHRLIRDRTPDRLVGVLELRQVREDDAEVLAGEVRREFRVWLVRCCDGS